MKLALTFDEIPDEIHPAMIEIWVEDQTEVDRPSPRLLSMRLRSVEIHPTQPTVVEIDPGHLPSSTEQLSVIVRAKSKTQANQPVEYLNTTTTPLPKSANDSVTVALSRIR